MKRFKKIKIFLITAVLVCLVFLLYAYARPFKIEGQWERTGDNRFGQFDSEEIVFFNGENCNIVRPFDTYSFKKSGKEYVLTVSSLLKDTFTFKVRVIDRDHIEISNGGQMIEFQRVD